MLRRCYSYQGVKHWGESACQVVYRCYWPTFYLYIYFRRAVFVCSQTPLAACVRSTWNLGVLRGATRGVSLGGRRKASRRAREERRTISLLDGKWRHVFCGFTDGEYEVPDNCDAPESQDQAIALSGQQHSRCSCLNTWWQRGSETESSA